MLVTLAFGMFLVVPAIAVSDAGPMRIVSVKAGVDAEAIKTAPNVPMETEVAELRHKIKLLEAALAKQDAAAKHPAGSLSLGEAKTRKYEDAHATQTRSIALVHANGDVENLEHLQTIQPQIAAEGSDANGSEVSPGVDGDVDSRALLTIRTHAGSDSRSFRGDKCAWNKLGKCFKLIDKLGDDLKDAFKEVDKLGKTVTDLTDDLKDEVGQVTELTKNLKKVGDDLANVPSEIANGVAKVEEEITNIGSAIPSVSELEDSLESAFNTAVETIIPLASALSDAILGQLPNYDCLKGFAEEVMNMPEDPFPIWSKAWDDYSFSIEVANYVPDLCFSIANIKLDTSGFESFMTELFDELWQMLASLFDDATSEVVDNIIMPINSTLTSIIDAIQEPLEIFDDVERIIEGVESFITGIIQRSSLLQKPVKRFGAHASNRKDNRTSSIEKSTPRRNAGRSGDTVRRSSSLGHRTKTQNSRQHVSKYSLPILLQELQIELDFAFTPTINFDFGGAHVFDGDILRTIADKLGTQIPWDQQFHTTVPLQGPLYARINGKFSLSWPYTIAVEAQANVSFTYSFMPKLTVKFEDDQFSVNISNLNGHIDSSVNASGWGSIATQVRASAIITIQLCVAVTCFDTTTTVVQAVEAGAEVYASTQNTTAEPLSPRAALRSGADFDFPINGGLSSYQDSCSLPGICTALWLHVPKPQVSIALNYLTGFRLREIKEFKLVSTGAMISGLFPGTTVKSWAWAWGDSSTFVVADSGSGDAVADVTVNTENEESATCTINADCEGESSYCDEYFYCKTANQCIDNHNGYKYCSVWCNNGNNSWVCGIETDNSYTCDCMGCNGCVEEEIDATTGTLTAPFVQQGDYVELPYGTSCNATALNCGGLEFWATCNRSGDVKFEAEVIALYGQDSFFLQLDDGSVSFWGLFSMEMMTGTDRSTWFWSWTSPSISMTSGSHAVKLHGRETGVKIRAVRFASGMSNASCRWHQVSPTRSPTESPTWSPTQSPTESPTEVPTASPTQSPTESPTLSPTQSPTESPTMSPTASPTQAYFYWIDDGCEGDSEDDQPDDFYGQYVEGTDAAAGIRCCNSSTCETVGFCPGNYTQPEAYQSCSNLGMRLCSKDELASNICCGKGGGCDNHAVWTSTIEACSYFLTSSTCPSDACIWSTYFSSCFLAQSCTSFNTSEACPEYYCSWTGSACASPCSSESDCLSEMFCSTAGYCQDASEFWVDDGCHSDSVTPDDVEGHWVIASSQVAAARCCSDNSINVTNGTNGNGTANTECSTPGVGCPQYFNYTEASELCTNQGLRLCTKTELLSDVCCGTGGSCDSYAVWTSTGEDCSLMITSTSCALCTQYHWNGSACELMPTAAPTAPTAVPSASPTPPTPSPTPAPQTSCVDTQSGRFIDHRFIDDSGHDFDCDDFPVWTYYVNGCLNYMHYYDELGEIPTRACCNCHVNCTKDSDCEAFYNQYSQLDMICAPYGQCQVRCSWYKTSATCPARCAWSAATCQAATPAPTEFPTQSPTQLPTCVDSDSWYKNDKPWRDCAWVSANPESRCHSTNDDGVLASEACCLACA